MLAEIERLARAGVGEITLIGQNVNAYHGRGEGGRSASLADLIAAAAKIPGVLRLRYATSHPNDMSDDLIRAHREIEALAPYLHLPIQSGSDRILSAMNRRHDARDYLDLVARVRRARPDIALSSDFIVGFPGESDADFEETLALVREVGFASSYAFKYSARPGTPAAEIDRSDRRGDEGGAPRRRCSPCSKSSAWPSTAAWSDAGSTSCSTSRVGARVRSSAARPICSPSTPRAICR